MMMIYICEDSLEGILTGVYDAWASKRGHDHVKLQTDQFDNYELFAEYSIIKADQEKSLKVARTINERMGYETYTCVCQAAAGNDHRKADCIYRLIVMGLSMKNSKKVMEHLSYEPINFVFKLSRTVWREAHNYQGFVRFQELADGLLCSVIKPKHDVLELIAPHFEDRLPNENFLIYDTIRKKAVIHAIQKPWFMANDLAIDDEVLNNYSSDEIEYAQLFTSFFKSITITERINPRCQMNMLPLRFRDQMVEFKSGNNILPK